MTVKPFIFAGNVGIGTSTVPAGTRLAVVGGNINVSPTGYGIVFPDGSFQTTATITGPTGFTGPIGTTGPASTVTGPTGFTGPIGTTGPASTVTGPTGYTGPIGAASTVTGPTGSTGMTGAAGTVASLTGPVTIGNLFVSNTTISTSTSSGAIINAGGEGIAGNINVGGTLNTFSGNVGIGTAAVTVGSRVSVYGGNIQIGTTSTGLLFPDGSFQSTAAPSTGTPGGGTGAIQYKTSGGQFGGDSSNFFYDPATHRVGIGTNDTSAATLYVKGNAPSLFNTLSSSDPQIIVGTSITTGATIGYNSTSVYGYLKPSPSGTSMLIWNSTGIGINGAVPANTLDISGKVVIGSGAAYAGTATAPSNGLLVQGAVGIGTATTASGNVLSVFGGNVYIGTTSSGLRFPDGSFMNTAASAIAGPTGTTGPASTVTGPTGYTGPIGSASTVTGPTGWTGPGGTGGTNGSNGATGYTGPTGAAGTGGTNGSTGPTGLNGSNGSNGATGYTGPGGTGGSTGPTGPAGTNGSNGSNGSNGATGYTGAASTVTGPTGYTGPAGAQGIQGNAATITISNDTSTNANTYYPSMTNNVISGAISSLTTSSTKLFYNPSSGALNSTQMKSTIFYDSDDTSYYTNPASTSYVNNLQTGGWHLTASYYYFGSATGSVNATSSALLYGDQTNIVIKPGVSNGSLYFQNYSGTNLANIDFSNGYGYFPFIYDKNDTGYYLNPNSTSRMDTLSINTGGISFQNGVQLYQDSSGNGPGDFVVRTYDQTSTYSYSVFYKNGAFSIPGNFTAPFWYDGNDTAYYVDPNSTSNMNYVYAVGRFSTGYDSGVQYSMNTSGWFRTSGGTGLYFASYGRGISPSDGVVSYGNFCVYGTGLNSWQGVSISTDNKCNWMANGTTWGMYNASSSQWMMQSDMSGNVTFQNNVTAYSDIRLKQNIRPIDDVTARRDTLATSAIAYERDGRTRIGYGAQFLRDGGCGEFVMEAEDSLKLITGLGTLSVDYGETAAVLAVASKNTDDNVAALEKRIKYLESMIEELIEDKKL